MLFRALHRKLNLIIKGLNIIMSQIDDLKLAISNELADVDAVLAKLSSAAQIQESPDLAQAIQQLQDSHTKMQAILNPGLSLQTVSTPVA